MLTTGPATAPLPTAAPGLAPAACADCGMPVTGDYCGSCGMRRAARLDARGLVREAVGHIVDLDSAFLRTFVGLTTRPGRTAREYADGRRRRYFNPLKYALISITAFVAITKLLGVSIVPPTAPSGPDQVRGFETVMSMMAYVMFVVMLPVAALQRLLFRRSGVNVAECYALGMFVFGHIAWMHLGAALLGAFRSPAGFNALLLAQTAYVAWGVAGFQGGGWGAAAKGVVLEVARNILTFVASGIIITVMYLLR